MANNNGIITAPVRLLQDVQTVLGVGSGGLGYIITHADINKWAKYKPFRSTSLAFSTDDGSGTWLTDRQKARENAAYGFIETPTAQTSITQLPSVNFVNNALGHSVWQYYPPNGTPYWFRMLDFDGYSHNAVPPFKFDLASMHGNEGNGAVILLGSPVPGWDFRTCLSLSDVASTLAGRPVGMLLNNPDSDTVYFLSSGLDIDGITEGTGSGVGFVFRFAGTQNQTGADYICHELSNSFSGGWVGKNVTAAIIVAPGAIGSQGAFAMKGTYELTGSSCKFLPFGVTDNPENWQTLGTNKSALVNNSQSLELVEDIDRVTLKCTLTDAEIDWNKLTVTKYEDIRYGYRGSASISGLGNVYYYNNLGLGTSCRFQMHFANGFVKSGSSVNLFMRVQYQTSGGLSSSSSVFPTERTEHFRYPDTDYGESLVVNYGESTKLGGFTFVAGDNIIIVTSAPQTVYCRVQLATDRNMTQDLHNFDLSFNMTSN